MASMYPERLPLELSNDGERYLFQQLKEHLSNDYTVIWHAHVTLNIMHASSERITIDFLLVHPQYGMLVLQVKSGEVDYDRCSDAWYVVDRDQTRRMLDKSPIEQAMRYMYLLCAQLDRQGLRYGGPVGYSVVLPDMDMQHREQLALKTQSDSVILLSESDIQSSQIQQTIEQTYQHYQQPQDGIPGCDGARKIILAYKRSWFLAAPHLDGIHDVEERLVELTEQQFVQLEILYTHTRAAIYGCSGTGKTLLAMEKARQLARSGLKVLFICQSIKLASMVAAQLCLEMQLDDPALKNIHAYNFRTFCKVHLETRTHFSVDNEPYMLHLLKRIRDTNVRYDAIIVDEGHDFRASWWVGLLALLSTKESMLYAFYDNNQHIQRHFFCDQYIPSEHHYPLYKNCRSTQKIHQMMMNYYAAFPKTIRDPFCSGFRGREIEYLKADRQHKGLHISEQDKLADLLDRLVYDEAIPITNIILLTPLEQNTSRFQTATIVGERYYLSWPKKKNAITHGHYILTCSSVHSFKGQERSVVILVELDSLQHVQETERVLYMAISRARRHFVVLGPGNSVVDKLFKQKST